MGKQYLNGVLYGTGEIIKFSPYIYSLEEREVGVWIDGKPLYQITLVWHNTELNQWIQHDISELNMDSLCYIEGYVNRITSSNTVLIHPLQYKELGMQDDTTYAASCRIRNDSAASRIDIYNALPSGNSSNLQIVTIQYTKTTDTPGSGHYTTNGGEAHHYSLTEQVIGTWIDGKPIYEKTYYATFQPTVTELVIDSSISDTAIQIRSLVGTWSVGAYGYTGSEQADIHQSIHFTYSNGSANVTPPIFKLKSNGLVIQRTQSTYGIYYSITIQYTKTTS